MLLFYIVSFFFFKQKTAYEMRISDWSSDVCSSDLICAFGCEFKLRRFCRVVGLDAAGKPSALDSFRPEVIERLDAHFPCSVVEHQQIPLFDVGRDEQVQ